MKMSRSAASGALASLRGSGLAYKVGLAVMATGGIFIASAPLLGGVVFYVSVKVLTLLGAPEDRGFFSPDVPDAGGKMLQFLGLIILAVGACIISLRLVIELLGLAGKPKLTGKLGTSDKLGLGATAIGFLVIVSGRLPLFILYEIFDRSYGSAGAMHTLKEVANGGGAIFFCGLAVLILGTPFRRQALLGWADKVGWGKLGYGWVTKLALGLVVIGVIGSILDWGDVISIVAWIGVAITVVGFVLHLQVVRKP